MLTILMYHRINDTLLPGELVVPVKKFEEQMKFLDDNRGRFSVVSLKDFSMNPAPCALCPSPNKLKIAITFDDGYRDNYFNAYPVLKKYNLPATIFLTTEMIGTDRTFKRYESNPLPDMLNWDEIGEMGREANGITFGAHTRHHVHLPQLTPDEQEYEIQGSMKIINRMVPDHARVNIFCYPYGEYDAGTLAILRDFGYAYAVTVHPGANTDTTPPLELKRTGISGVDDLTLFTSKLTS